MRLEFTGKNTKEQDKLHKIYIDSEDILMFSNAEDGVGSFIMMRDNQGAFDVVETPKQIDSAVDGVSIVVALS